MFRSVSGVRLAAVLIITAAAVVVSAGVQVVGLVPRT